MQELFKRKGGILLDIGCGEKKGKEYVGMDKRLLPTVDIVHDLEVFPYPLPDDICLSILAAHIMEHIKPWLFIDVMNELWRVAKPHGKLGIVHPYAMNSFYVQDPTHCNPINEYTWQYFDPRFPLWKVYRPKPWKIAKGFPVWQCEGIMEVLLEKITEKEKDECFGEFGKEHEEKSKGDERISLQHCRKPGSGAD